MCLLSAFSQLQIIVMRLGRGFRGVTAGDT